MSFSTEQLMNVFTVFGKLRSAFLGLERRRDCAGVPYGGLFGEVFEYFEPLFAKSGSFFAKVERN